METQKDRLLRHFQEGRTITAWEAMRDYGIMQLAARIFELKELGYRFITEPVKKKNRYGESVQFVRYSLDG